MPYEVVEEPFGEDWETVRRNFRNLRKDMNPPVPQARVYNNANISIATSGTPQFLTFNTERWDEGDLHSTSANTGRLTAPITGLYAIGACVEFASNATGLRQIAFRVNGTTLIDAKLIQAVNGDATQMNISTEYRLAAGDYVELRAYQTSGGALNVVFAASYSPEFWMHRVAGYVNQGV